VDLYDKATNYEVNGLRASPRALVYVMS
jgi:hypothetical protein